MTEDETLDPREAAEAAALAEALEDGRARPDLPDDALAVAALLRYRRHGGTLAPERKEARRFEVLRHADALSARRRRARLLGVAGGGILALAAAAILAVVLAPRPGLPVAGAPHAPSAGPPTRLPPPPPAWAASLSAYAEGGAEEPYADAAAAYRERVYRELQRRYGGGP